MMSWLFSLCLKDKIQDEEVRRDLTALSSFYLISFTSSFRNETDSPYNARKYLSYLFEEERLNELLSDEDLVSSSLTLLGLLYNLDDGYDFSTLDEKKYDSMITRLTKEAAGYQDIVRVIKLYIPFSAVKEMQEKGAYNLLKQEFPFQEQEHTYLQTMKIVYFFAALTDMKSSYTGDHSLGVGRRVHVLSADLGFSKEKVLRLAVAGYLHDLGKLYIPFSIMSKPSSLNDEERKIMEWHVEGTYQILRKVDGFDDISTMAAHHHEKLDGSGYLRHLKGDELSFEDRIITICDIYQALKEERIYKPSYSTEDALKIMDDLAEKGQIDKNITRRLKDVFPAEQESIYAGRDLKYDSFKKRIVFRS